MAFFQTIDALEKDFDGQKETIKKNLRAVMEYVLRPEHLVVSCTSRKNGLEAVKAEIPALKAVLFTEKLPEYDISEKKEEEALKEGIKIPTAVQYVARAGHIGYYTGAYRILKVILSYDYLWFKCVSRRSLWLHGADLDVMVTAIWYLTVIRIFRRPMKYLSIHRNMWRILRPESGT